MVVLAPLRISRAPSSALCSLSPIRNTSQNSLAVADGLARDCKNCREELHAIEAVIAGQGIGIFSDVLVARELAAGTLVKAFNMSLPGYRFYVVRFPGHSRERTLQAFERWVQSVI